MVRRRRGPRPPICHALGFAGWWLENQIRACFTGAVSSSPSAPLQQLAVKIDGFFDRVMQRHPTDMQCASGCADCCMVELSVTAAEAAAVTALVAALATEVRDGLGARARAAAPSVGTDAAPAPDRCCALDENNRCSIYAARPIVCRSHGVPVRLGGTRPEDITSCHRNFTARGPAAADADCVLDQTLLSAMLLTINRAGGHGDDRRTLRDVIADATRRPR